GAFGGGDAGGGPGDGFAAGPGTAGLALGHRAGRGGAGGGFAAGLGPVGGVDDVAAAATFGDGALAEAYGEGDQEQRGDGQADPEARVGDDHADDLDDVEEDQGGEDPPAGTQR